MSKGIGIGYLKRMRRFHVPFKRKQSSYEYISKVVDRRWYYDGTFRYKLPRYFLDRLYRKKFPCVAKVYNKKTKVFEPKTVFRYKSKNMLSLQMQAEIRARVLAEYNQRVSVLQSQCPDKSDTEIHIMLSRAEKSSRMARQKDIYSKMSRFYNYNRFKHTKID